MSTVILGFALFGLATLAWCATRYTLNSRWRRKMYQNELHRRTIITDKEILDAVVRFYKKDYRLSLILNQLFEVRQIARDAVAYHDLSRPHYGMSRLAAFVMSNCECTSPQCTNEARTIRLQKGQSIAGPVCYKHADEGDKLGRWNEAYPHHKFWVNRDIESRSNDK